MSHNRILEYEKLRVMLSSTALMLFVYWLVADMFTHTVDPMAPLVFIPMGAGFKLAMFAALAVVFILVALSVMTGTRPTGAMAIALIGLGGIALHSEPALLLLGTWNGSAGTLYSSMLIEVLVLALSLLVAEAVGMHLRDRLSAVVPALNWSGLADSVPETAYEHYCDDAPSPCPFPRQEACLRLLARHLGIGTGTDTREVDGYRAVKGRVCLTHFVLCAVSGLIFSAVLMRTDERGQILFSLFAGYTAASLLAYHFFPSGCPASSWGGAVIGACVIYLAASLGEGGSVWVEIAPITETLPLDWITAGCGGALLGSWIGARTADYRLSEAVAEEAEADAGESPYSKQ